MPLPLLRALHLGMDLHTRGSVGRSLCLGGVLWGLHDELPCLPSSCPPLHKPTHQEPILSRVWVSGHLNWSPAVWRWQKCSNVVVSPPHSGHTSLRPMLGWGVVLLLAGGLVQTQPALMEGSGAEAEFQCYHSSEPLEAPAWP